MSKIKKVTRSMFSKKQLDILEQYHYLYRKAYRIGLSEDELEYIYSLSLKIKEFVKFY